jgi:hypothetical protein
MCTNCRSIEWHQKIYHKISWDYPFNDLIFKLLITFKFHIQKFNFCTISVVQYCFIKIQSSPCLVSGKGWIHIRPATEKITNNPVPHPFIKKLIIFESLMSYVMFERLSTFSHLWLKGTVSRLEIFDPRFFILKHLSWAFLIINLNSQWYSNF